MRVCPRAVLGPTGSVVRASSCSGNVLSSCALRKKKKKATDRYNAEITEATARQGEFRRGTLVTPAICSRKKSTHVSHVYILYCKEIVYVIQFYVYNS